MYNGSADSRGRARHLLPLLRSKTLENETAQERFSSKKQLYQNWRYPLINLWCDWWTLAHSFEHVALRSRFRHALIWILSLPYVRSIYLYKGRYYCLTFTESWKTTVKKTQRASASNCPTLVEQINPATTAVRPQPSIREQDRSLISNSKCLAE